MAELRADPHNLVFGESILARVQALNIVGASPSAEGNGATITIPDPVVPSAVRTLDWDR